MKISRFLAAAVAVTTLFGFASSANNQEIQDDTLRIEIVRSNLSIPIAVPDFISTALGNEYTAAAAEIAQIVRDDLNTIDMFNLADQALYASIGRHTESNIPFELYTQYKIDALALGKILPDPKGMRVEARLFSIRDRSSLFGRAIVGGIDQSRYIGHTIASYILYHFTGDFGIFKTRIVFSSNRDLEGQNGGSEIWIMDWDGHNQRRVTYSDSLKAFPVIGPGDSGIVYTSFINRNADIYRLSLEGGTAIKVFASEAADSAPAISPDGTKVVFSSSFNGGNMDIYICNIDGSNVQRLTTNRGIDTGPCWSPDGRMIAYSSSRTGTVQIYTMNADGSNERRITFEGRYNDGADWSPDGRYIAYAARRIDSKTFDIRIHDLTINQTYYVTRDVENDENPSFSPDGRSLAFTSDRNGAYQIFTVGIDGRNMRQLTFLGENKHPSWSK